MVEESKVASDRPCAQFGRIQGQNDQTNCKDEKDVEKDGRGVEQGHRDDRQANHGRLL